LTVYLDIEPVTRTVTVGSADRLDITEITATRPGLDRLRPAGGTPPLLRAATRPRRGVFPHGLARRRGVAHPPAPPRPPVWPEARPSSSTAAARSSAAQPSAVPRPRLTCLACPEQLVLMRAEQMAAQLRWGGSTWAGLSIEVHDGGDSRIRLGRQRAGHCAAAGAVRPGWQRQRLRENGDQTPQGVISRFARYRPII
jgi:hypothetical protein